MKRRAAQFVDVPNVAGAVIVALVTNSWLNTDEDAEFAPLATHPPGIVVLVCPKEATPKKAQSCAVVGVTMPVALVELPCVGVSPSKTPPISLGPCGPPRK